MTTPKNSEKQSNKHAKQTKKNQSGPALATLFGCPVKCEKEEKRRQQEQPEKSKQEGKTTWQQPPAGQKLRKNGSNWEKAT